MNLHELLATLEYDQSSYYRNTEAQFEPETVHLFRSARKAGVDGIYVFQTSISGPNQAGLAARPAVFVAEVKTEDEAKQIHQRLWNLCYAPFLIILLPHQIRIYTGFDYSSDPSKSIGLLQEEDINRLAEVKDLLSYFSADAVNSGQIWRTKYAEKFDPNRQVDVRLLANLRTLSDALNKSLKEKIKDNGQRLEIVHSLIGKYIYIRYLKDRNILSDEWLAQNELDINNVLGRNTTVKELQKLINRLEDRFNGYIFPLNIDIEQVLEDTHVGLVASIFKGDEISFTEFGLSKQLHLDFQAYDFEYIPVETLSAIYEQFLRTQEDVKQSGAIYTPEFLADYLLSEVNSANPLTEDTRILDPACGSGIFLVLAYRRLIEMRIRNSPDGKLPPESIKGILVNNIYGIERNRTACYVTEFSLILTLLHYIDPPELHKNPDFKFPNLHNEYIFECDFFDDESKFWQSGLEFDWIVGNPPWVELEPNSQGEDFARMWMVKNADDRPVAGNRVAEAFSWRVVDKLKSDAIVGLILPATSLFNLESEKYRKHFFQDHQVTRITNFANLRDVLFDKRATLPAATIIYGKWTQGKEKSDIVHYGPFLVNQRSSIKNKLWAITINENEIQFVPAYEAESGETSVWKFALWGSHFDKRAIARLRRLFPTTLEDFCIKKGWGESLPCEGPQLRKSSVEKGKKLKHRPDLRGKKLFNTRVIYQTKPPFRFSVSDEIFGKIENTLYVRRGEQCLDITSTAPHLIISAAWGNFIIYSDEDFVIPPRQMGISCPKDEKPYLKALSVYLTSSLAAYYIFFNTQEWGVFRNAKRVTVAEVRKIPTPDFTPQQAEKLAGLQEELAEIEKRERSAGRLTASWYERLQKNLDEHVFSTLQIPEDIAVLAREFTQIRLKLDRGWTIRQQVVKPPRKAELIAYAKELSDELDDFALGRVHHNVSMIQSDELIECKIEITTEQQPIPVNENSIQKGNLTAAKLLSDIREHLNEQFSQWMYVQRGLRLFDGPNIYIYKTPRLIDWTRTQALNDASDIIGQIYETSISYNEDPHPQPEYP